MNRPPVPHPSCMDTDLIRQNRRDSTTHNTYIWGLFINIYLHNNGVRSVWYFFRFNTLHYSSSFGAIIDFFYCLPNSILKDTLYLLMFNTVLVYFERFVLFFLMYWFSLLRFPHIFNSSNLYRHVFKTNYNMTISSDPLKI